MKIRVLLINGAEATRRGLRELVAEQSDMSVADEVELTAAGKLKKAVKASSADVAIVLVSAYGTTKVAELVSAAKSGNSKCKVVLLSALCDPAAGATVGDSGSDACLSSEAPAEDILALVRDMAQGGEATREAAESRFLMRETDVLTDREREILKYMGDGYTTKEVASMLDISPKTVETHRLNFMNKLRSHSVAELTKLAIREGLSSLKAREPAVFNARRRKR